MKKYLIYSLMSVVMMTISVGLKSCSKDDDGKGGVGSLYRKWKGSNGGSIEFKKDNTFIIINDAGTKTTYSYNITDTTSPVNYEDFNELQGTLYKMDITPSIGQTNEFYVYHFKETRHNDEQICIVMYGNGVSRGKLGYFQK